MIRDLLTLTNRQIRSTVKMPVFVVLAIIQPMFWMFLFGSAFGGSLAGTDDGSYIAMLAPGFAIMSAYFGSAYSGVYLLQDAEKGVLHRQLSAPVSRVAIVLSYILHSIVIVLVQAGLILAVTFFLQTNVTPGLSGVASTLLAAALVAVIFASLSIALALGAGRSEPVIGIVNFLGLPLLFLSQILSVQPLPHEWMQAAAEANPLNWGARLARSGYSAFGGHPISDFAFLSSTAVLAVGVSVWMLTRYVRGL